jgi:hypothetical protein
MKPPPQPSTPQGTSNKTMEQQHRAAMFQMKLVIHQNKEMNPLLYSMKKKKKKWKQKRKNPLWHLLFFKRKKKKNIYLVIV